MIFVILGRASIVQWRESAEACSERVNESKRLLDEHIDSKMYVLKA